MLPVLGTKLLGRGTSKNNLNNYANFAALTMGNLGVRHR